MAVPKTFVDLSSAYRTTPNTLVNIIGTVVDIQPPTLTRSQYMMTFKLLDESLRDALHGSRGLTVRFFADDQKDFPRVERLGDMVLLRGIRITMFTGQIIALSTFRTSVLVFPAAAIPAPNYQIAFHDKKRLECLGVPNDVGRFTLEEQNYVIQLKHAMSSVLQSLSKYSDTAPVNAPSGPAGIRELSRENVQSEPPSKRAEESVLPEQPRKRPGEDLQSEQAKRQITSLPARDKLKTISEVRATNTGSYADLCVQVVKKFPAGNAKCDLYVTDYTENKAVFPRPPPEADGSSERDGDQYGYSDDKTDRQWPGPYGYLVLKVNLQNPHAGYANRDIKEDDFVRLQNVKFRNRADHVGGLEGDMWPDHMYPEKVSIRRVPPGTEEVKALLERKKRYWAHRNAKLAADEAKKNRDERSTRKSRKAANREKKKLKKQEKNAAKAEKKAAKSDISPDMPSHAEDEEKRRRSKVDINPHVRCGHREIPLSSIRIILDPENKHHEYSDPNIESLIIPFINATYRTQARVVDFEPKQLEDFARLASSNNEDSPDDSVMMIDYESSPRYEWSFELQLESIDQHSRLWVQIGHQEAQYLFGNDVPDPGDLRQDRKLLAKVREKLCILWGNVEEKGEEEAVSNLPFECCVKEYGVLKDEAGVEGMENVEKVFSMFGVNIS
ncbi:uncharacterized protein LTR77_007514 [Saxophila tyrrhenica]|uniref:Protection of telomeres protein 1 n=1 Tax=Saxophila tyrrhenica TaxID=1690608 RepID=A0AAV9P916_9PEZI|nr:hypothetical protein LTR77_007514 [Saxophila tyrrhenica]